MSGAYQRAPAKACDGCKFHDWDSRDEYSPIYHYCELGLILPKKETCKRKQERKPKNPSYTP